MEDRIIVLENIIKNAEIISDDGKQDSVRIGSIVTLLDKEFNEEVEYKIVGSEEADPIKGFISNISPVGKAVLGSKKGETVIADTPGGKAEFQILEIK